MLNERMRHHLQFAAGALALVAVGFSAVMVTVMLSQSLAANADPYNQTVQMAALQAALSKRPTDEQLKTEIRQRDQLLRRNYFRLQALYNAARWLLPISLILAAGGGLAYGTLRPLKIAPPMDPGHSAAAWSAQVRRRSILAGGAAAVIGVGLGVAAVVGFMSDRFVTQAISRGAGAEGSAHGGLGGPSASGASAGNANATAVTGSAAVAGSVAGSGSAAGGGAAAALSPALSPDEIAKARLALENWPEFRGPLGTGLVPTGTYPTSWNGETDQKVIWKSPNPGPGLSSPVVWGDRLFVTSADTDRRWVHCLDAGNGQLLWSTEVKAPPNSPSAGAKFDVFESTGYAAPTPATDGELVFATFANADVACLDFTGRQLWCRNFGPPESAYGLATSLRLYRTMLLLQLDQGADAEEGRSALIAMDKKSGAVIWKTPRPTPASWSTPIIVQPEVNALVEAVAGGRQTRPEIVTLGTVMVISYDPITGRELWRFTGPTGDIAPSPIFNGELFFVVNTNSFLAAIRPGGAGDVTATHQAWRSSEGDLPDTVSPLADRRRYLQIGSSGGAACYESATGKLLWTHEFETSFQASPCLVGKLVYLPASDGRVFVFELADTFKIMEICPLGDKLAATPAFVKGRIYLRGYENIYCIGEDAAK